MGNITHFKQAFTALTGAELLDLQKLITDCLYTKAYDVERAKRDEVISDKGHCPECGGKYYRWGKTKTGTQRFRCAACKATISTTTGTPVYRLQQRDKWQGYIDAMTRHLPLKHMADRFGIHISTAHRWRHRILSALNSNPETPLAGVVEADEKFFRVSWKGDHGWVTGNPPVKRLARRFGGKTGVRGISSHLIGVLTALDRSGAIKQTVLPNMRWPTIIGQLTPWVEKGSVICSDGHHAYARAAKQADCEHIATTDANGLNTGTMNIGRTNAYHRDVENLINRKCYGVSTRYLLNYFGWARRMSQKKPFGAGLFAEMIA